MKVFSKIIPKGKSSLEEEEEGGGGEREGGIGTRGGREKEQNETTITFLSKLCFNKSKKYGVACN